MNHRLNHLSLTPRLAPPPQHIMAVTNSTAIMRRDPKTCEITKGFKQIETEMGCIGNYKKKNQDRKIKMIHFVVVCCCFVFVLISFIVI